MSSREWFFKRRPISTDLIQTGLTNIVVLVCTVLTYGLAAKIFTDDSMFSVYGTFRRLNVAARPVIALGMALAMVRYLPLHAGRGWAGRWRLLSVTTGYVVVAATVMAAIMLAFPRAVSFAVLGDSQYADLVPGLVAIIVGTLLHSQVASYFRGRMMVDIANLMLVLNVGIIPLAALFIVNAPDLVAVLMLAGTGLTGVSMVFLVAAVVESRSRRSEPDTPEPLPGVRASFNELLSYGLPRVPGFIAMSVMWIISPILVNQMGGLSASIYIVLGMQMLSIAATPVKPLATVLLPRFSEMKAQGRDAEMSSLVRMLGTMLIQIGVFIAVQLVVFMPILLQVWLDRSGSQAVLPVSIIALSIPAFLLYESLRSIIDSYTTKPLVAYVAMVSLALLITISLVLKALNVSPVISVAIATSVAFYTLGILVYIISHKLIVFKQEQAWRSGNFLGIVLSLAMAIPGYAIATKLNGSGIWTVLGSIAAFELAALACFIFILYRSRTDWALELFSRIRGWTNRSKADTK